MAGMAPRQRATYVQYPQGGRRPQVRGLHRLRHRYRYCNNLVSLLSGLHRYHSTWYGALRLSEEREMYGMLNMVRHMIFYNTLSTFRTLPMAGMASRTARQIFKHPQGGRQRQSVGHVNTTERRRRPPKPDLSTDMVLYNLSMGQEPGDQTKMSSMNV
jgi:hypothetical protein